MKDFLKQVSVYGILPVVGKFAGFILIPIYARQFEAYEFGIVELLVTLAHFLMFACNLEFYSAIGRYFYEKNNLEERRGLISTGLFLTVIATLIVVTIAFLYEDRVVSYYLEGGNYKQEYRISLIWLIFSAFYTYLGVIPRYEKRPKVYVAINVSSLLVRLGTTILYILVLDLGIAGVLYGHLTGAFVASVSNFIVSYKYIGLHFNLREANRIIKFSTPIVPGLLIVGFWQPLSRSIMANYFSIKEVGLFAFAIRITSVLQMLNLAVKLAWNPMIFENYKKESFKKDLYKISKSMGILSLSAVICLTLLAPEIALYIGTTEYAESGVLIGFLSLAGVLEILRRLRGFGPLIQKKTYLLSLNEFIGIGLGLAMLVLIGSRLGLVGLGLAFTVPPLIKYLQLVWYTEKNLKFNFFSYQEVVLLVFLIGTIVLNIIGIAWYFRITLILIFAASFIAIFGKHFFKLKKREENV